MTTFTARTATTDPAINAASAGEAVHAESTSTTVAAVAAFQRDLAPTSAGAALFGECHGGGSAIIARQMNVAGKGAGLFAQTLGLGDAVVGEQKNQTSDGAAIVGRHAGGKTAGFFQGNVIVTGDLSVPGADCAEEFPIAAGAAAEPGTVMALGFSGELVPSRTAYNRRVVGVVTGAGTWRPAIVMGRQEGADPHRQAIALVGTVFCKVDARDASIEIGDLLTTSSTEGHAMKASDPARAFGAVIGKAMAPQLGGLGLIPILISLQ